MDNDPTQEFLKAVSQGRAILGRHINELDITRLNAAHESFQRARTLIDDGLLDDEFNAWDLAEFSDAVEGALWHIGRRMLQVMAS